MIKHHNIIYNYVIIDYIMYMQHLIELFLKY